ncbi:MAG TPA: TIGR03936 family radical SAM-associated protein [Acidimicrobiales bacterium]|nr:TIGR03936 family radical SAM-associated protein [Acidimicrobiales bacterium]
MKVRLRYDKRGKIRFLSHRDLARVWERALRRAAVRVAYSEGFSPRPRLSFGLALSTGYESLGEYVDIDLHPEAGVEPTELPALVTPSLPVGMTAQVAVPLDAGTESLQAAVTSSTWEIEVVGPDRAGLQAAVTRALEATALAITVERKGSPVEVDARPAILALALSDGEAPTLTAELATQPRSLRPAELLRALDPAWREGRVLRTHQWTLVDGARCEPIPLGDLGARAATSAPHAEARAS